jgi:hypothetical protein
LELRDCGWFRWYLWLEFILDQYWFIRIDLLLRFYWLLYPNLVWNILQKDLICDFLTISSKLQWAHSFTAWLWFITNVDKYIQIYIHCKCFFECMSQLWVSEWQKLHSAVISYLWRLQRLLVFCTHCSDALTKSC